MAIGSFKLPIFANLVAPINTWAKPAEWIDISAVGNNEINLLVKDGAGIAFSVDVAGGGTYTVDWGNGTIQTLRTSGAIVEHLYNYTGGTNCPNLGYMVYKIRIYNATNTITNFRVRRTSQMLNRQYHAILWAVFGTVGITNYANAFFDGTTSTVICPDLEACVIPSFNSCTTTQSMFFNCYSLQSITLPASFGNVTNTTQMFNNCYSLQSITLPQTWGNVTNATQMFFNCVALQSITLPTSWGNVTNATQMFNNCYSLQSITLPQTWGNVTNVSAIFNNCYPLQSITLPTSWGNVTNTSQMFINCVALQSITLPTSWGNVTNATQMFNNCISLQSITLPQTWGNITNASNMFAFCHQLKIENIEFLGHRTQATDMSDFMRDVEWHQSAISIGAFLSRIGIYGASGRKIKTSSIRLTNTNSTFTGASPHVNVSHTDLSASALNLLFGDLPTLTGKTIVITGATGANTCNQSIATSKGWAVIN